MSREPMAIFTRSFDFLTWILPVTNHFPRAHRHTVTRRLLDASFEMREHLEAANRRRGGDRIARLRDADEALDRVRVYVRLTSRWGWLSDGQYRHASEMLSEVGRLLGGWLRSSSSAVSH